MAEYSRFFGGPEGEIPEYNQTHDAEVYRLMFTSGVFTDVLNELEVVECDPNALAIRVNTGWGYVHGFWYHNTALLTKSLETADPDNPRIDRIVLRLDTVTNFKISCEVLKGTPEAEPTAPTLTQTASTYEISLAQVLVGADVSSVSNANITDEREYVTGIGGEGAAFWTNVPGTPTRVSDTQFTITDTGNANKYDLLFKKGVILKWLENSTFQTAMIISSSYAGDTVTINIVGDSLTAGFTSMQYCTDMAIMETFIIPGNLAAGTDLAKTFYCPDGIYIISADLYVKTAGATNNTVVDINDDGTTKFTTKPTLVNTAVSDIDNVADNPSTEVAKASKITIDIDSVSDTAPIEAYIYLFFYPVSWRYR